MKELNLNSKEIKEAVALIEYVKTLRKLLTEEMGIPGEFFEKNSFQHLGSENLRIKKAEDIIFNNFRSIICKF